MLKQYKIIAIASIASILIALFGYFYIKSERLELKVENMDVAFEVAKDESVTEIIEERWKTISIEHNKTLGGKKGEIKEPVSNDNNSTDFFFFWMPSKK